MTKPIEIKQPIIKEEEREEDLTKENDEMDLGTINFTITFD